MKEVWKTILYPAPKDLIPKNSEAYIVCHIATDGTICGIGVDYLNKKQKEEIKTFYKENFTLYLNYESK
jgi:hypothetical protein